jgi:hypothetical protein
MFSSFGSDVRNLLQVYIVNFVAQTRGMSQKEPSEAGCGGMWL